MNIKRYSLLLIACFVVLFIKAQTGVQYTVSGKITSSEDGNPLELVTITFGNNTYWAISDLEGRFSLKLKSGDYRYEVSYIGFEKYEGILKVGTKNISNLHIKLTPSSLGLEEVVVTAQEKSMGSASVIDQTALQHLQPKSVEDILQLTPGNLTKNPSLSTIGQATIRETSTNASNSLGTAIIVDGAPISNDGTLQMLSTTKTGTGKLYETENEQNTTGRGVDLRSISPDNIENIEVIRGIPSVEYGNLTSGAVIIKTKQGATPLDVRAKVDPNSKMVYAGKGLRLAGMGTLNLSMDYTSSYSDTRFLAEGFERITGDIGYNHSFFQERPLSLNAKVSYYRNLNSVRIDPQQRTNEKMSNENQGIRFVLNGDWNVQTKLLSNLSYNFTASYSHQEDYKKSYIILHSGITPIGTAMENSEYPSHFLNASYYAEHWIDGKPLDLFAQLKGSKTVFKGEDFISTTKVGLEWKYNANKGEGLLFDNLYPPFVRDVQTIRPRAYSSIPALQTLSGFLENKTMLPVGTTYLTLQAGVRATELFINRRTLDRSNMVTAEPRFNAEWKLLNEKNNTLFEHLSVVGGWGMTAKTPPLAYLYPDKAYFDQTAFSYISPDLNASNSLVVMNTKVVDDTSNPHLKASIGRKLEFGLSGKIGKATGNITFFTERYENEFGFSSSSFIFPYLRYSIPSGASKPEYKNGTLYYTQEGKQNKATYACDTTFNTYSSPTNNKSTHKMGIEYSFNFGQIPYLKTSLVVDGAWLRVEHQSSKMGYTTIATLYQGKNYPYTVLYPSGSGNISQRVNTNLRFITHIPELKMVFSTTAQIVWGEREQSVYRDNDGNNLYYKANNLSGVEKYFVDPVGFLDREGIYHDWDTKYRDATNYYKYYMMIKEYSHSNQFGVERYPAHVIFNFRLTKEFGKNMELSFMANNLFNTRKTHKNTTSNSYTVLTIPMYFGAEIKLKI